MRRFRFDLEKLLELRSYHEREAELELARAMAEVAGIHERLEKLAQERVAAASERFAPGRVIAEIRNTEYYLLRLDRSRDQLLDAAAKAELLVAQRREVYIEKSREKKVLEKLKEKRFMEYRKERAAEEIKSLDEVSSGAAARKQINT